jgi:hypothetical protein
LNSINYDRWKLHTPDDDLKVFCTCECCGQEIYEGEEYLEIDGDNIHEDCFDEYAKETLDPIKRVAGE